MNCFGKSVEGIIRKNNEDSIYVSGEDTEIKNIFIVADGMGGHSAGEVASSLAIKTFVDSVKESTDNFDDNEDMLDILIESFAKANKTIYSLSLKDETTMGMGTTFTCAYISGNKLIGVHAGDSRIYALEKGVLKQITNDHSFVMEMVKSGKLTAEEARVHPKRNIITRALGTEEKVEADTVIKDITNCSAVLLCSDGLSSMVEDSDIEKILNENKDAQKAVEMLIEKANDNGGKDNISVVIIRKEVDR